MNMFVIRGLDIVLAVVMLVLFLPVLVVVSIAIVIDDGFPVFFLQDRLGYEGKSFRIIKFRTMRALPAEAPVEASINGGAIEAPIETEVINDYSIKCRNDPRTTRLGQFLRTRSIDELPQLLNILMGHMSFVGPRPWVPVEYGNLPEEWGARQRLTAKPGLTGLAQISGRSDLSLLKIIELDRDWIGGASLVKYFQILWWTGLRVSNGFLRGEGAY